MEGENEEVPTGRRVTLLGSEGPGDVGGFGVGGRCRRTKGIVGWGGAEGVVMLGDTSL